MTRICGLIDPAATKETLQKRLHSMAKTMKHHPDSPEEYLLFKGGGIALVGNPSFTAQEKRWAKNEERASHLALCGRIVGFGSRTETQDRSEVPDDGGASALLGAFEEHGEGILKELNGTFAFAHYDPRTRTLTVANDRYGFMPLYYCREGKPSCSPLRPRRSCEP